MLDSKVIETLRILTPAELGRFVEFAGSAFFNKNKDIPPVLNYLMKFAPAYDHGALGKESLMERFQFPEKKLVNLMSVLQALLEQFLSLEESAHSPLPAWLALADRYHRHGLTRHYRQVMARAQDWLDNRPHRNLDYHWDQYRTAEATYQHADSNIHAHNESLQLAADALDQFYLASKLSYTAAMMNFERTLNTSYQKHFAPAILTSLEGHSFAEVPVIAIYRRVVVLLTELDKTEAYFDLKKLLAMHASLLTTAELKQLYDLLLNFCTWRHTRLVDRSFQKEYLDLNIYLLQQELLLDHGILSPWRYSNLVTVAIRVGELDWAWNFLQQYKCRLPEAYAENMHRFKLGEFYFATNKPSLAQSELNHVGLNDPFLALSVKNLLAKIYYETGETELLLSFLEAYRIFVHRLELIKPEIKTQVRNFIDTLRKMTKLAGFEKEKLLELQNNLPAPLHTLHHEWLAEKLEEKIRS
jgi:hypothetical protein